MVLFNSEEVKAANDGATTTVLASVNDTASIVYKFTALTLGPQMWQNVRGSSSHEGSCVLWSLWFSHMVAQFATKSLSSALNAGVRSILENDDVDAGLVSKVFREHGTDRFYRGDFVRIGDAMTRFIHRFATQLMSMMPEQALQKFELMSWRGAQQAAVSGQPWARKPAHLSVTSGPASGRSSAHCSRPWETPGRSRNCIAFGG